MKHAYCRVSSVEQGKSKISLDHQAWVTERQARFIDDQWGEERYPPECQRPGYFVDVKSAYRQHFFKRPAGKALLNALQPGDSIIVSRLDRGFRSAKDFCQFIDDCLLNDWNFVCAEPQISLATPQDRLIARMFALMAEFESDMKSIRIKEALAAKKTLARMTGIDRVDLPRLEPQGESDYRPRAKPVDRYPSDVKPGRIVVYIRCSHRSSVESGLGLRAQINAACEYADALHEDYPQLEWRETVFTDAAVSALKFQLKERPQGRQMNDELKSGDVVVILRPDRVFCSIMDMSETMLDWKNRGITVHFAESGVNVASPHGEMFLTVLVSFAQYERQIMSSRAKEARMVLENRGMYTGGRKGHYPPFRRSAVIRKKRVMILDGAQIVAFRMLKTLVNKGFTVKVALQRLEECIAIREGRPVIPASGVPKRGKWKDLPNHYIPNNKGLVFPTWTEKRYFTAVKVWDETLELWRKRSAEDKAFLRQLARQGGYVRHRSLIRRRHSPEWVDRRRHPEGPVSFKSN